MVTYTITTTADFDAGTKGTTTNSYNTETVSDNLRVTADSIQLESILSDTFSLAQISPITNLKWNTGYLRGAGFNDPTGIHSTTISGGTATITATPAAGANIYGVISTKKLTGDFDIQRDSISYTISNACGTYFMIISEPTLNNDYAICGMWKTGGGVVSTIHSAKWNNVAVPAVYPGVASTKFRIIRQTVPSLPVDPIFPADHHYVDTYYYTGGGWVQGSVALSSDNLDNDTMYLAQAVYVNGAGLSATLEIDDFKINSGTVVGNTPYITSGTWISDTKSMPVDERLKTVTITYSGVDTNHTIIPKILNAAGATLWTGSAISSGTSITYNIGNFGNIDVDFKVEVDLAGNGTSTPVITEIVADTVLPSTGIGHIIPILQAIKVI